tara:strand:+ start:316 stop:810 length:495 start_codon:yes stop_codon:yes gene_type:complete
MNLFRKGFILLFLLLFPVVIFLFLKFFGDNEYKLSVYKSSCLTLIKKIDVDGYLDLKRFKIFDIRFKEKNVLVDNYIKKLNIDKEIEIITLSEQLRNLDWMNYVVDKSVIDELSSCMDIDVIENSFILLIDNENNLRGLYNSTDRKEIERLDVEIDILKLESEK